MGAASGAGLLRPSAHDRLVDLGRRAAGGRHRPGRAAAADHVGPAHHLAGVRPGPEAGRPAGGADGGHLLQRDLDGGGRVHPGHSGCAGQPVLGADPVGDGPRARPGRLVAVRGAGGRPGLPQQIFGPVPGARRAVVAGPDGAGPAAAGAPLALARGPDRPGPVLTERGLERPAPLADLRPPVRPGQPWAAGPALSAGIRGRPVFAAQPRRLCIRPRACWPPMPPKGRWAGASGRRASSRWA